MKRPTLTDAVEAFLRANPDTWIAAVEFERIGGRQAWRTRLSDCRVKRGMQIENRIRRVVQHDYVCWRPKPGACICTPRTLLISEYRFVAPAEPRDRDLFEEASA